MARASGGANNKHPLRLVGGGGGGTKDPKTETFALFGPVFDMSLY